MPEMPFEVQWPDGMRETCYSPSTVIKTHLSAGSTYTIAEFVAACDRGLRAASDRVREVYGYACSSATDQLSAIEKKAEGFESGEIVRVESIGGAWRRSA